MEKNSEKIRKLEIRKMRREEAGFAIEMAAAEGWNPGIHDGELFYEADHKGFFIAEVEGKPVGCASAVAYDDSFGFFGLYVVNPEFRKKGIGMKLTEKCLEYLEDRNIGLDGVVENEKKYQQVMKFRSSYSNLRFEGRGGGEVPDGLMKTSEVLFEKLLAYDRKMFPAPRSGFLEKWVNQPDSYAFAALEEGNLKGYGVIRKCRAGYKIGPLFADDRDTAEKIFRALRASVPGETVYLDVPEPNKKAMEIAKRYNMNVMFKTIRMYSRKEPDIRLDGVYGVTSFELG
ncbi:GCN5 family acetyltransferase [Methanosarcina sp. 2.H.T.1A.6]|uniref:GNAT family N-acetyltransferase n=1 Tax=unclassified Methanosarcina TaxID=2644672 RepID=UPI0006222E2A|nr:MULTISPECIES: GNAT family N-acetyltransferase [unclassified Methanosarcina]KKG13519.1 GCN5 family acetyltransferase [Methanosarcina sp. 2.H.T.1A.3]KKG19892.1 GCN5 family acetyltransferase [Methanosarcina sp. 2.H.T.1A.15]KKG24811.1 GCN5 family acetyltransferase [Methanosarcina sp. 2.H.T.1A.6]KKG26071.1 GCN5 family acetyltransferase [Methanosarcina sp. 2.H.T.1A.8]